MERPDCRHGVDVQFAIALPNRTTLPATREAGLVQIPNPPTDSRKGATWAKSRHVVHLAARATRGSTFQARRFYGNLLKM